MAGKVFLQILNMSYIVSYVIMIVILARLMIKKCPKIISYLLWSVVLFRLFFPISMNSNWSLLPAAMVSLPSASSDTQTDQSDMGDTAGNIADKNMVYDAVHAHRGDNTVNTDKAVHADIVTTDEADHIAIISVNPVLSQLLPRVGTHSFHTWLTVATMIWGLGMAVLLLINIVSLLRLRHRLIGAVRLRDNIYIADHISSPFILGVIHPKIYLPLQLSEEEQRYIILHEQTHLRRFDHIIKIMAFVGLTLHWFNPLVWLAYYLSANDMEMACDECVIKHMNRELRADYSALLLSLTTDRRVLAKVPLAFNEGDIKHRIRNIVNYKRPTFWGSVVTLIVAVLLVIGLSLNPQRGKTSEQGSKEQETGNTEQGNPSASNLEAEEDKSILTLEALKAIAQNGKSISWEDFAGYKGSEIGSGLYIRRYPIEEQYYVLIGGAGPGEKPMYVRLYHDTSGKYIDLETEKIDDFIKSLKDSGADTEKEEINSDKQEMASDEQELVIDNIGSVLWYLRKYQGTDSKSLQAADRYEIVREELDPDKASVTVIEDKIWNLWDRWDHILITLERLIYLAAKDDEDSNRKSPVLVSLARDGSDRRIYEAPYRVVNQLTMDNQTEKIYFTGWTKDQSFPQPLYEIDETLKEAKEVLRLNGWLIAVHNDYAYYFTADRKRPGIYRVMVSGTEEPELIDKLGFTAENYTPVIYAEMIGKEDGRTELHYLLKSREGEIEGRVPISH